MECKLYVVVRKDLDKVFAMVQGAHAVAEYLLQCPNSDWKNQTLVFVQISDYWALTRLANKLSMAEKPFVQFFETDLNNELTSIACYNTGEVFKNLQLVK